MPTSTRQKWLLRILLILLFAFLIWIFALDEDQSTLNVIRRFVRELIRAV